MVHARGFLPLSFSIALLVGSASAGYAQSQGPGAQPGSPAATQQARTLQGASQRTAARLQGTLAASGYEVALGGTKLFTIDDCQFTVQTIGNCMGPNPAAPYVIPVVPPWSDEYVDPAMKNLLGPLPRQTQGTFRMGSREALLVVGWLPPPGKYFGIQTYVFSRKAAVNTDDPVYKLSLTDPAMHRVLFATGPDPSRVLVFSSIGNSQNNVTIEGASGAAFNQRRAFVISTDAGLARDITDTLVRAHIADRDGVFVEPVSTQVARTGLDAAADDFMTLIRYAHPQNEAAGTLWREHPPLLVLRIRDRAGTATEPWPAPQYDPKGGNSELALQGNLDALVAAVKQQWGQPAATGGAFRSLQESVDLIGQHCLARPMSCLGDTQDADYQASPTVDLDGGKIIAVAGTLGTATGNASYVGLSVNWMKILKGVTNVSDDVLQGSASAYSGTVANTDKLYLHYYARDCTGIPNCQQITEAMVPSGEVIKIIQRNYVAPGTARGADPAKVLNPVAIVLDGSSRPAGL
jgi:hypothetical protein